MNALGIPAFGGSAMERPLWSHRLLLHASLSPRNGLIAS